MTDAWFAPEVARYFAFFSLLALAACLDVFAKRGEHRAVVMAIGAALIALGVAFLAAGLLAVVVGQPRFVVGPLLLVGFVLTTVCVGAPSHVRGSRAASHRRLRSLRSPRVEPLRADLGPRVIGPRTSICARNVGARAT
jgi:hypothetical protein